MAVALSISFGAHLIIKRPHTRSDIPHTQVIRYRWTAFLGNIYLLHTQNSRHITWDSNLNLCLVFTFIHQLIRKKDVFVDACMTSLDATSIVHEWLDLRQGLQLSVSAHVALRIWRRNRKQPNPT